MKEKTIIEEFRNGLEKLTDDERIAIYKVLTSYITAYIRSENMPNDGVVGVNTETKPKDRIFLDLSSSEIVNPLYSDKLKNDSVINDINNGVDYRKRLNDKLDKIIQQTKENDK